MNVFVASVTGTVAGIERVATDESVVAFVVFEFDMMRKCAGLIDRNSLKSILRVESSSAN
ncbi:MAG: hypothetical protein IJQ82_12050 [Selenomonadaceae bacterium]|nr:hypothetical protein [Selenomonadaceae bacterium]